LGCLVHELCMLEPTFSGASLPELTSNICQCKRVPISDKFYSRDVELVVSAMLTLDANKRPSMEDLKRVPKINKMAILLGLIVDPAQIHHHRVQSTGVITRSASELALSQRLVDLTNRERTLGEKEKFLIQKEDQLRKDALQLQQREKMLSDREMIVVNKEKEYVEKERYFVEREMKLAEEERRINEAFQKKRKEIEGVQAVLANKSAELESREADIKRRSEELDRLRLEVDSKIEALKKDQMQLSQKEAQFEMKQSELEVLLKAQQQINSILSTDSFYSSSQPSAPARTPFTSSQSAGNFHFSFQTPCTVVRSNMQPPPTEEATRQVYYDEESPMQSPERSGNMVYRRMPVDDDEIIDDSRLNPHQRTTSFSSLLDDA